MTATKNWQFHYQCFLNALMFFTRLPISRWVVYSEEHLNKASAYLPLVGFIVGCFAALSYYLIALFLPIPIAVLLSLITTIYITGALHEDGFADCCDGFGGGWTKEQILTIMKDSRLGTYGTLGLIIILSLKFTTLCYLPASSIALVLIASHTLSRLSSVFIIYLGSYVSSDLNSKSKPLSQPLSFKALTFAALTSFLSTLIFFPFSHSLYLFFISITIAILAKNYFQKKLQGFTGDTLGATQQVTEVCCYLSFLALGLH